MSSKDVNNDGTDHESPLPEEFEDDLNEDWESAFQADDFVFSQDEGTSDFFSPEEKGAGDINLDSLTGTQPEQEPPPESTDEKEKRFLDLPQWQRVCLLTIPLLMAAAVILFFLFPRTTPSPPQEQAELKTRAEKEIPAVKETSSQDNLKSREIKGSRADTPAVSTDPTFHALPEKKIRRRLDISPIFVTAANENDEALFVSVDITLLLNLKPARSLTEKERIRASDIIYQFFKNRPGKELEDYALNRGRMIKKIQKWSRKNWPEGPLDSIIINSYQVDKS